MEMTHQFSPESGHTLVEWEYKVPGVIGSGNAYNDWPIIAKFVDQAEDFAAFAIHESRHKFLLLELKLTPPQRNLWVDFC